MDGVGEGSIGRIKIIDKMWVTPLVFIKKVISSGVNPLVFDFLGNSSGAYPCRILSFFLEYLRELDF